MLKMACDSHKTRDGGRTVRVGGGGSGGNGTSTGSVFGILCGRNDSLTSCKKASASASFGTVESCRVSVMGGGFVDTRTR